MRGGPGILFPYALGLDQDLTQYITIYTIYLIQNYSKLLETITKIETHAILLALPSIIKVAKLISQLEMPIKLSGSRCNVTNESISI